MARDGEQQAMTSERLAALLEVVRAVAQFDDNGTYDGSYCCHWCGAMDDGVGDAPTPHTAACPVTQARTLVSEEGGGDGA